MASHQGAPQLWLVRHGETEWSAAGKHTGRTDIPLTEKGREQASALRTKLRDQQFAMVLSSPLARAYETARLAGFHQQAQIDENLLEWDYGIYEGKTTQAVRSEDPDWAIWTADIQNGEQLASVWDRARQVILRAEQASGDVLLFAHGHLLRILATCWLGLTPDSARLFALDAASVSVLGYEREVRVVRLWNDRT